MRLAIICGHEQSAQGASAGVPLLCTEYEYNSDLAKTIKGMAEQDGIEARIFFRDNIGITACYRNVEAWDPVATVELHFNSFSDPKARGTETLCGDNQLSFRFASYIQAQVCMALGRNDDDDRGVKRLAKTPGERGWYNVNSIDGTPQCLIEPFFGSCPGDCQLGKDKKTDIAQAVVDGFLHWFHGGKEGEA